MRDRVLSLILFLFVSSIYYSTAAGVTSSNDGSHYALLRAIVDERRFAIDTFVDYTENVDLSVRGGQFYSDRAPGTALVSVPFYVAGQYLPRPLAELPSNHNAGNPRLAYLLMLPALAGAASVLIVYQLLRSYSLSIFAALTASLAFAFGTINWKYGSVLYSHALAGFLVLGGVGLAIRSARAGRLGLVPALLLGFVLGLSVLVEYSNAALLVIVVGYLAVRLRRSLIGAPSGWPYAAALMIGAALPIGFLMWYNTLNFGGPFAISYSYQATMALARSLATTYVMPLSKGVVGVLWYGFDWSGFDNQGLFLLMPVTLVGLAGVGPYVRRHCHEAILVLGVFLIFILLTAKHVNFPDGTRDGRYLAPYLGLWVVPMGFALDGLHRLGADSIRRTLSLLLLYGLLFLSIRNIAILIGYSYNYNLDFASLSHSASTPSNWETILGSILLNWRNVPLLWMVEVAVMAVFVGATWAWRAWGARFATWLDRWMPRRLRLPLALSGAAALGVIGVLGLRWYFQPAYRPASASAQAERPLGLRYEGVAELTSIYPPIVHARPGESVRIILTWRAIQPTQDSLMVYLHSLDGSLVRYDSNPSRGRLLSTGWLPTQTWVEMVVVEIPSDAEQQVAYPLIAGLYDPQTDSTLIATDANGNEVTPIVGLIAVNGPTSAVAVRPYEYRFGDVIGMAQPQITRQGDILQVCLPWVSLAPTAVDYHVFVHVLLGDDLIAQVDSQPKGGLYPTSVWLPGEAIDDCVRLDAGNLHQSGWKVAVGLYELPSGLRLPVVDASGAPQADDAVVLAP